MPVRTRYITHEQDLVKVGDFRLDPVEKQKWIKDLRSGKFQQGRGALRTFDDRYCCLGVKVCRGEWVSSPWSIPEYAIDGGKNRGRLTSSLPTKLLPSSIQGILMDLNDTYEWTFLMIADWIEKYL